MIVNHTPIYSGYVDIQCPIKSEIFRYETGNNNDDGNNGMTITK